MSSLLLILAGDIELNPGPNMFQNVVQGSFHQGDRIRFGNTAGTQCTCCCLTSLTLTLVKTPGRWHSRDLDFIVENGDRIYKSLNKIGSIEVTEIPSEFSLLESPFKM